MIQAFSRLRAWLSRKGNPIGECLWGVLVSPLLDHILPTPDDKARAFDEMQRNDPLARLGLSKDPPAVWKSLLWWAIFIVGMGLTFFMAFLR